MQVKWRESVASASISCHSRFPPAAVQREITERKPPGANMSKGGPLPSMTYWTRMPLSVANGMGADSKPLDQGAGRSSRPLARLRAEEGCNHAYRITGG